MKEFLYLCSENCIKGANVKKLETYFALFIFLDFRIVCRVFFFKCEQVKTAPWKSTGAKDPVYLVVSVLDKKYTKEH